MNLKSIPTYIFILVFLVNASGEREAKRIEEIKQLSKDFEAIYVSSLYNIIIDNMKVDPYFGGGQGEKMFRTVLNEERIKDFVNKGEGFGFQKPLLQQMLKSQEGE